jgi:hypothetical protein
LSLKGPFQGKAFLFPLRGNYLSPGQLNINKERRKKNGCIFCLEENQRKRTREGFKSAEQTFKDMKKRNCMIIIMQWTSKGLTISVIQFFNISET